jgi:hypothetical protein
MNSIMYNWKFKWGTLFHYEMSMKPHWSNGTRADISEMHAWFFQWPNILGAFSALVAPFHTHTLRHSVATSKYGYLGGSAYSCATSSSTDYSYLQNIEGRVMATKLLKKTVTSNKLWALGRNGDIDFLGSTTFVAPNATWSTRSAVFLRKYKSSF